MEPTHLRYLSRPGRPDVLQYRDGDAWRDVPVVREDVPRRADGSLICCPECGCFHERGACVVWG